MDSDKTKTANTSAEETQKAGTKKSASGAAKNSSTNSSSSASSGTSGSSTSSTSMMQSSQTSGPKDYSQEATKDGPLYKFFLDGLKDMYFAEKHILEALPKMKAAATTEELQDAFEDHHLVTQKQVSRLEKVFKTIEEKPEGKKCEAIIGILKEGESIIQETEEGTMTRDAALIIAAQKVEHYEIASYGGLVALAETLGLERAADLLQTTLEEEEETDLDLTDIAESFINFRAAGEDEDDDSEDYEYDDDDDDPGLVL
ncbi:Ferritin-like metal-binding protein YciE [Kaistella treverensis]|uniref:Ferritin-like metal-binding protein YciE n=1 Tax=Kaistella treverensis TaxID=631455 RepID=A0A1I3K2J3_9FLAO|nr:ferritin-like domain-containing protein [Kaistella treverensis]SFI66415.1 Ferritin-like metal-binding protein YciE [Kaistella treverensis]